MSLSHIRREDTFFDRIGIPFNLLWGFVGITIFMIGDGLEQGWLSPYLIKHGLTMQQSAFLYSDYGIAVTIASWLSGIFVQTWGPRKAMTVGLTSFVIGAIGFIGWGIPHHNYPVMLLTYALRGLGYPLFSYSFLVWITYRSPEKKLSSAVGWFWFVFTLGLNVLGSYYSSFVLPKIGAINTLWSALIFVLAGAILAILINKDEFSGQKLKKGESKFKELSKGITIVFQNPRVGIGGLIRTINTTASFGFVVFYPSYVEKFGYSISQWLSIYGTLFAFNIICNLIFGIVGDKLGRRTTVAWFGGVLSGLSIIAMYYVPQVYGHNYWLLMIVGCLFGAGLAGYVPLSALMPSLEPENKGAAMSILNLGAGLSSFVGPGLVSLFFNQIGTIGIMWIFSILYFISAGLTNFLKDKREAVSDAITEPNAG
ncbi:MFS transporter [Pullulanibacillus sp. KACC 23026]|uniref:MFS transporter n=1 Tax=Pullulanibacillus sp. KACC 23026 TaxID=3028315 RepID=UPI0023AFF279|nr:MFS transporter [Pullulanibacillus sp. KACC 23026]WEG13438.1 MFS transporter [Pullulanibacillus sp. KACC 23026]